MAESIRLDTVRTVGFVATWEAGAELVSAVRAEIAATRATPRRRDLGVAEVLEVQTEPTSTTFRVDLRGQELNEASMKSVFLAASSNGPQCDVEVLSFSPEEVLVRADIPPPTGEVHLFAVDDPVFVLERLAELLDATTTPRVGADVVGGRLRPGKPFFTPGFNEGQNLALGSIAAEGLAVIWGPPGTGKTRVIARAIERAVAAGKSILLASNTNIAVDEALHRAWSAAGQPAAGTMVRLGRPATADVANHPSLPIARACEQVGSHLHDKLRTLQAELADLEADPRIVQLRSERAAIGDFTPAALEEARRRAANRERREEARVALEGAKADHVDAKSALTAAAAHRDETHGLARHAERRRKAWATVHNLEAQIAELDERVERERGVVQQLEQACAAAGAVLVDAQATSWLGRRGRVRAAAGTYAGATARVAEAQTRLADVERSSQSSRADAERLLRQAQSGTDGVGEAEIAEVLATAKAAEGQLTAAREAERSAMDALNQANKVWTRVRAIPTPTRAQLALIERAVLEDLPARYDALVNLEAELREVLGRVATLEGDIARIREELRELATTVTKNAKVVATTLATLVTNAAAHERTYDFVIIDEVSAAQIPFIAYASTLATRSATLIGDFLQNGPITAYRGTDDRVAARWLGQDIFEHLGLISPSAALAADGCAALTEQYRFGGVTTELANRVAYDGILTTSEHGGATTPDDGLGEVVLVDTDPLDSIATVSTSPVDGKRGWWEAGAYLARAIAESHPDTEIGVVTPYRSQVDTLNATFATSAARKHVDIGTSHRFQGREFPVVIFDLVEDGTSQSWVAKAATNGNAWQRGGLRLANVAITRNQGRLYLIGSLRAIAVAKSGPLAAIREMVRTGTIAVLGADSFLPAHARPKTPPIELRGFKRIRRLDIDTWVMPAEIIGAGFDFGVYDSAEFIAEFERRAKGATRSIWMWAPFTGRRFDTTAPLLADAAARGVDVNVFLKPPVEKPEMAARTTARIEDLRSVGVNVIPVYGTHEKIVVIDDEFTFVGSLNALSFTDETLEIMLGLPGEEVATSILRHRRAVVFARGVRTCQEHQALKYARNVGQWRWICAECGSRAGTPVFSA